MSEDEVPINALRKIRASVRAGISPKRRSRIADNRTSRDPQLLGSAVDAFLSESGMEPRHQVARVLDGWPDLVGEDVASHVAVERFDNGELVLRADSTAWATQMRLLQATVERRLEEQLGAGIVSKIIVLGPEAPKWTFGNRRVPGRGPRDTYG